MHKRCFVASKYRRGNILSTAVVCFIFIISLRTWLALFVNFAYFCLSAIMAFAMGRKRSLLLESPFSPIGDYAKGIAFFRKGVAPAPHKKLSFLTSVWGGLVTERKPYEVRLPSTVKRCRYKQDKESEDNLKERTSRT